MGRMVLQSALRESKRDPCVSFEVSDHGDMVLAGLTKLRDMEQLFDVVLIVEKERLPAHRVVLASCSDYFRAMFTDGLVECRLDEIQLNGVTAVGMKALIDFAYSSKIDIDAGNIDHVLSAANHIQIIPVIEACEDFLRTHLSLSNCLEILNAAELFSLVDLKNFVYKFISKNFLEFSLTSEFLKLTTSQLSTMLELNYPVNCTECDVLSVVIGWIVHHHGYQLPMAGNLLQKVQLSNMKWADIEKIPNFCDLGKLTQGGVTESVIERLKGQVESQPFKSVRGLVNLRGYEETLAICGGFRSGKGMTNEIQCFNKSSGCLKVLTQVPHVEQCNFGLTVMDNKLYVVGGCYNDDQMQEFAHGFGFCYDPMKDVWHNIPPMTTERCRFYLGSVGSRLYAIGGDPSASMETGDYAHCECYDLDTRRWQMIEPLPGNRMEHCGTTLANCLYISGGLQDQEGPVFDSFYKYDPDYNTWTQMPPMLTPRADHGMFSFEGKIYVIGGWYEDEVTQQRVMARSVDCYDPIKGHWEVVSTVESPRLYATYSVLQNQVLVVGGWLNGNCQRKCSTVEAFDLKRLTWSKVNEGKGSTGGEIWEHSSCSLYLPVCRLEVD